MSETHEDAAVWDREESSFWGLQCRAGLPQFSASLSITATSGAWTGPRQSIFNSDPETLRSFASGCVTEANFAGT